MTPNLVDISPLFRWQQVTPGHAVVQLVKVLRYELEGRGFDSPWRNRLTYSFQPHCGIGVDSGSNWNEDQEYFLGGKCGQCVGLTTLALSYFDCREIWEPLGRSWPIFSRFLDHTQRRTTVGKTPLDEWSIRHRDLYLTKHNNHNIQTSMPR